MMDRPDETRPAADPVRIIRRALVLSLPLTAFWAWRGVVDFGDRSPFAAWDLIGVTLWLGATIRAWFAPARHADSAIVLNGIAAVFLGWQATLVHWLLVLPALLHAMAGYGMLMGLLTIRRAKAEGAEAKPAPAAEAPGYIVKENVEAIIVAFVMALVIRCFCIEVFKIPSSSMEPTLLGDVNEGHRREGSYSDSCHFPSYHATNGGDQIMVTKYYYAFHPVERFDVAVFKFPLNRSKNFIKRVVGLPGESLLIENGDLYVKPKGEKTYSIASKPLRIQEAIWIQGHDGVTYLQNQETFDNYWKASSLPRESHRAGYTVLPGEGLRTLESGGARGIQFTLRDAPEQERGSSVGDLIVSFTVDSLPDGEIFTQILNRYGAFTLRLSRDPARSVLEIEGQTRPPARPLTLPGLAPGMPVTVELMVFDGLALARVNGKEAARHRFIEKQGDAKEMSNAVEVSFGAKETLFTLQNLRVGRDIAYRADGHFQDDGEEIPDNCYLMMGDNVQNSWDGRKWREYTFHLKDGTEVRCESQDLNNSKDKKEAREKYGWKEDPDYYIRSDAQGVERSFDREDTDRENTARPYDDKEFMFVEKGYLVGKAFWIWWPFPRGFPLIR